MGAGITAAIVRSPLGRLLGMAGEEAGPDRARIRLPFAAAHTTVGDIVHGGAIAALIDTAATAAAWSGIEDPAAWRGTTIGLSVAYLRAARAADLVAEARVVRRGSSLCYVEVAVSDPRGELVATGNAHYKLSRQAAPAEG